MYTDTMTSKNCRLACFLLILFVMTSCSFAKPEGAAAGKPADRPDILLTNASYIVGLPGQDPLLVRGATMEIYEEARMAFFTHVEFEQHDAHGDLILSGSARSGQVHLDTHNAEFSGSVTVEKHDDDMLIFCDTLSWNDAEQTIETPENTKVTVRYASGNEITGIGFTGKLKESLYEFSRIEEGLINP